MFHLGSGRAVRTIRFLCGAHSVDVLYGRIENARIFSQPLKKVRESSGFIIPLWWHGAPETNGLTHKYDVYISTVAASHLQIFN